MRKLIIALLCLGLICPVHVRAEETQPAATEHSHTWETETVEPTCTQPGSSTQTCSCGEIIIQPIPAAGHSFSDWTDGGDGTHSRVCTVCSVSESAGHSWGEGEVTAAPTCTETGTKVFTCGCGARKSDVLPVTDHTYGAWTVDETAHSRSCVCGKTESGAHSWDVSATVPATCLEEGATAYGCSTCGAITYEVLPKLTTHTYDNVCDPDCNICGAVREAAHKFSTQWTKNAKGHWHACAACGQEADFGNHYPGPAATEEKAQLCLTCGYTLTARLGHSHTYESQWSSDETGHWYACSGCDDRKDFAAHSYDNACDAVCNDCGYLTSFVHSYSGSWFGDASGHWDVCTICQEKSTAEPHIPGPEATAEKPQTCEVCGYELMPILEHVHEDPGLWQKDLNSHWKLCSCAEEFDREPHNWDAGTEQEDTTVLYKCLDCGQTRTEGVPQTDDTPPVWIGAGIGVLLILAAAALLLLIFHLRRNGRYRR